MKVTFLKRHSLAVWLLGATALGLFWFYCLMNPWLGFINSDGAIPFQMVLEPWRPQDLYYWETVRMGMLYEVFWKAGLSLLGIRESVVGNSLHPELFYLVHVLIYFFGLVFWMRALRARFTRLLFLVLFLPLSHRAAGLFLSPGQPYGVVFFLNGLFLWVLFRKEETRAKHMTLGVLLGFTYIQHELAFVLFFAAYVARCLNRYREWIRTSLAPFLAPLIAIVAVALGFKHESAKWLISGSHYDTIPWREFAGNLWESLRWGRWSPFLYSMIGHLFTLAVIAWLVEIGRDLKTKPFYRNPEQTLFLGALAAFVLIHASFWYVLSHKDSRYFTFISPIFFFAIFRRLETSGELSTKVLKPLPAFYATVCLFVVFSHQNYVQWMNPVIRWRLSAPPFENDLALRPIEHCRQTAMDRMLPPGWMDSLILEIFPDWHVEACRRLNPARIEALAEAITAEGCAGYLDDYWSSHILVPATAGRLTAAAGNHIRNPELYARIHASRPLCVMPRRDVPWKKITDGLHCRTSAAGFLVCND